MKQFLFDELYVFLILNHLNIISMFVNRLCAVLFQFLSRKQSGFSIASSSLLLKKMEACFLTQPPGSSLTLRFKRQVLIIQRLC